MNQWAWPNDFHINRFVSTSTIDLTPSLIFIKLRPYVNEIKQKKWAWIKFVGVEM